MPFTLAYKPPPAALYSARRAIEDLHRQVRRDADIVAAAAKWDGTHRRTATALEVLADDLSDLMRATDEALEEIDPHGIYADPTRTPMQRAVMQIAAEREAAE